MLNKTRCAVVTRDSIAEDRVKKGGKQKRGRGRKKAVRNGNWEETKERDEDREWKRRRQKERVDESKERRRASEQRGLDSDERVGRTHKINWNHPPRLAIPWTLVSVRVTSTSVAGCLTSATSSYSSAARCPNPSTAPYRRARRPSSASSAAVPSSAK